MELQEEPFNPIQVSALFYMGQSIQEWTKKKLFKTVFKKLKSA